MIPKVNVCIIGAGASGLAAAQRLFRGGIKDLVIVEAQDRVGGRIHTVSHDNHVLEYGAHWIHGEEGNVVFKWASENNHVETDKDFTQTGYGETVFVKQDGEIIEKEVIEKFMMVAANMQEEAGHEWINCTEDLGTFMTKKYLPRNTFGDLGMQLLDWYGRYQCILDGADNWHEPSARGQEEYHECPGNPVVNWKDGYRTLINDLKSDIPIDKIMLNSPVKHIDWNASNNESCKITLNSNMVIETDHVISTLPLKFLKQHHQTVFNPPLPLAKSRAIEGLGINVVDKIYLKFPSIWWDKNCDGFSILKSKETFDCEYSNENWELGILGFYQTFHQPNILCAWITGKAAVAMENTPNDEVAQRCTKYLRKLLSKAYNIPDPIWSTRSTWATNPYIGGSYSFRSMLSETMDVWASDLAKPCLNSTDKPVLCFAGEATHDHYYSTVHGAVESGRREADRILNYINSITSGSLQSLKNFCEVLIVGGGAAGLSAAKELKTSGVDSILILEGSNRIGGRVKSIETSANHYIDLGAQWIHGQENNILYEIGHKNNLIDHHEALDGKGDFYQENGSLIPPNIVEEVRDILESADDECITFLKNTKGTNPQSVGAFFKEKFDAYLQSSDSDTKEIKQLKIKLFNWFIKWYRIDNSCDTMDHVSTKFWGEFEFCEGLNNLNPRNGMVNILKEIGKDLTHEIKFNKEVVRIEYANELYKKDNTIINSRNEKPPVIVTCRDGDMYYSNHVIVTSSVGFLKDHLDMFCPPLPLILNKVISSIGFGVINKIFIEFDYKWWPNDCTGMHLVWDEPINKDYLNLSKHWTAGISGFDPVFNQPSMLCGWIGGPEARYMESLPKETVAEGCHRILKTFTGNETIPFPCRIWISKWNSEELIKGSYCFRPIEWDTNGCTSEDLNCPVMAKLQDPNLEVPVVVLAGEANNLNHYSTVHGAIESGISQAQHYLNCRHRFCNGALKHCKSKI